MAVSMEQIEARLARIEGLLARLAGDDAPAPCVVAPAPPVPADLDEAARRRSIQEEGRFILQTQGLEAYQRFWKEQSKRAKSRPRGRRAA